MRMKEGIHLDCIKDDRFQFNYLSFRFVAPMDPIHVTDRVLVANLLESANQAYPTLQSLKRKLADLYGATLETSVAQIRSYHVIEVSLSYAKADKLPHQRDLFSEMMELTRQVFFEPLLRGEAFDEGLFQVEQQQLLQFLGSETEDPFYHAGLELHRLWYHHSTMQIPAIGDYQRAEQATATSCYKAYRQMMTEDEVYILALGDVEKDQLVRAILEMNWPDRPPIQGMTEEEKEILTGPVREKIEHKPAEQSILVLGYHLEQKGPASAVFSSYFSGGSHSRLFRRLREELGLAYTVFSDWNPLAEQLGLYMGMDADEHARILREVDQEIQKIRLGEISEVELERAKKMLSMEYRESLDLPHALIDRAFRKAWLKSDWTVDKFLTEVDKVTVEDLQELAHHLKLRVHYFMEGKSS